MNRDTYPEWEAWQQTCRVCERVKCPKPEAVGEWLEQLVRRLHELMLPDLKGSSSWRSQVAHYECLLQCYAVTWSWALRGVCPDCLRHEDPKTAAYLDMPELCHFDAAVRWSCISPDGGAVALVRANTPGGLVRVPAVWRFRGLAVHPSINFLGPSGYVVTHDRSGFALTSSPREQQEAVALAELLSEAADWESLSAAEISADTELRERVRSVLSLLWVGGAR
ncbi:hypothetical protein JQX13_38775 [Archangium violaceum]|uniref:hypothetical protein n=1 Tax=Archangium violaceum TaxID=83451 RepID=UPI00193C5E08|nr:hypothetical protein [Archangium violaceum]QRK06028.1 hypothetical protein JQX13_38775 [Archangium violaceum]